MKLNNGLLNGFMHELYFAVPSLLIYFEGGLRLENIKNPLTLGLVFPSDHFKTWRLQPRAIIWKYLLTFLTTKWQT